MSRQPSLVIRPTSTERGSTRGNQAMPARLALILGLMIPTADGRAGVSAESAPRSGTSGMSESHNGSLLVDYYESYLQDHDIDAFRQHVSSRYLEGTLARLVESPGVQSRRAAVLALGTIGSFEVNAAVAKALKDRDPTVRSIADSALWAIWFRADTPENNAMLGQVARLISQQRFEEAVDLATRLIARAPGFAEAYNQRAIAEFFLGRFKESAEDCRRVVERNPYHFGALGGLAKCHLQLGQRTPAIETLRRASRVQPFNQDVREWIATLEAGDP